MYLELDRLSKQFDGKYAVHDLSLGLEEGGLLCILGSSGCGKTTTLNMIGGFLKPDGGRVLLDGQDITALPPERRPVSTVFQSYGLFPHMSVLQNVTYGLNFRGYSRAEAKEKGRRYLSLVGLAEREDARIGELSGGQQQRVALARALIVEPKLCLLDEPLSNLDAKLRAQMRTEIAKLHKRLGTTFIYVTHDQTEAMTMGDRIVVMKDGFIQQVDTPQNLYDLPVNEFVAGFMGSPQMNFIDATLAKEGADYYVTFGAAKIKVPANKANAEIANYVGKEIVFGIRPEDVHDEPEFIEKHPEARATADVEVTELMGAETYLYLNCEGNALTARVEPTSTAKTGDKITIALDMNKMHLFDKETEKTILN